MPVRFEQGGAYQGNPSTQMKPQWIGENAWQTFIPGKYMAWDINWCQVCVMNTRLGDAQKNILHLCILWTCLLHRLVLSPVLFSEKCKVWRPSVAGASKIIRPYQPLSVVIRWCTLQGTWTWRKKISMDPSPKTNWTSQLGAMQCHNQRLLFKVNEWKSSVAITIAKQANGSLSEIRRHLLRFLMHLWTLGRGRKR